MKVYNKDKTLSLESKLNLNWNSLDLTRLLQIDILSTPIHFIWLKLDVKFYENNYVNSHEHLSSQTKLTTLQIEILFFIKTPLIEDLMRSTTFFNLYNVIM